MADWIISLQGEPCCIVDDHCFRDIHGSVIAWLFGNGVYALCGDHVGWFEAATLYDLGNNVIGHSAGGPRPHKGAPAPDMPPFQRRPHVPPLKARRPRPAAAAEPPLPTPPARRAAGSTAQISGQLLR